VNEPRRMVWDLPVRLIHWGLVLAVAGAWATQEIEGDWFRYHVWCGYAVLVLTATRIVWGLFGTRHALFARFVRSPGAALHYALAWVRGDAPRYAGHNPLGAWMIVAMLAMLATQAVTGLFANDQILNTGPLFGYVSAAFSDRITTVHKSLFDWIIAAIAIHVAAAFAYLVLKRENLIGPMFTGHKPAADVPEGESIGRSRTWLAIAIAAALGAILALIVRNAPEASLAFF